MSTTPVRISRLVALGALSVTSSPSSSKIQPAPAAIADQIFADTGVAFMTGAAEVATITNFGQRQISRQEYEDMRCAAKAGFLRFTSDDGVHINTEPTAKGEKATRSFVENDWSRAEQRKNPAAHFIKLATVDIRTERVVEDRTIEKGPERYRVLGVVARSRLTGMGADLHNACDAMKISPSQTFEQKWRLLAKWDGFSKKWKAIVQDSAPADRPFSSDNVGAALGRIGS